MQRKAVTWFLKTAVEKMGLFTKITYSEVSFATQAHRPLSLFQLQQLLRETIENAFPASYWVIAEISEVRLHGSGHCYLTLTEKDSRNQNLVAQAKGTIWRQSYKEISTFFEAQTGQKLRNGLKILFNASLRFHELYGFNLDILDIDPNYTIGDLARQRQETINKLEAAGLLQKNKEKTLAEVPQKIAVISSSTAAGYGDFINQLANNPYGYKFKTTLFEAAVQGNDAAASVTAALRMVARQADQFDAVVLIRGGGAQTDLLCFDNYELAAAIGNFPLPVLTGIGHERDETIADMAAHTKLKTPTAVAAFLIECCLQFEADLDTVFEDLKDLAAEIVKRKRLALENRIFSFSQVTTNFLSAQDYKLECMVRSLAVKPKKLLTELDKAVSCYELNLINFTRKKLEKHQIYIMHLTDNFQSESKKAVSRKQQQLEHLSYCLSTASRNNLATARLRFEPIPGKVITETKRFFETKQFRLELTELKLKNHDPEQMLLRGYTLTFANGKLIKATSDLKPGDVLETRFAAGKAESTLTKVTL